MQFKCFYKIIFMNRRHRNLFERGFHDLKKLGKLTIMFQKKLVNLGYFVFFFWGGEGSIMVKLINWIDQVAPIERDLEEGKILPKL